MGEGVVCREEELLEEDSANKEEIFRETCYLFDDIQLSLVSYEIIPQVVCDHNDHQQQRRRKKEFLSEIQINKKPSVRVSDHN